ncbi:5' nucleotidase, NT5C type [Sinorhizobium meliloti]|uniref:5' nucleotidase, NT5C type n=1 Tax=Rhizobium meliloti TaxID=382 RepID=UPI003D64A43F
MTIYLDLDGVLADFDKRACEVLNGECHYRYDFIHGGDALWASLNAVPDFFRSFDPMPDAHVLWDAVKHLDPVILTALPKTNAGVVDDQKRRWVAAHFGIHVRVITCETKDKPLHCKPGDILIDDRSVNLNRWNKKGGTFILHSRATFTVAKLKQLGVI